MFTPLYFSLFLLCSFTLADPVAAGDDTALLREILPLETIIKLKNGQRPIIDYHEQVTILFSNIVGFTTIASRLETSQLMMLLHKLLSQFDALTDKHNVFKVETIGDAYMVAAGHDEKPGQFSKPPME